MADQDHCNLHLGPLSDSMTPGIGQIGINPRLRVPLNDNLGLTKRGSGERMIYTQCITLVLLSVYPT